MTRYQNLLRKLQKEIKIIESTKNKKRWKPYQKIMIDYINGSTKKAIFEKDGHKIILSEGDNKKGFIHILLGHYKTNDLDTMDIVNIFEIYIRGEKILEKGVSNKHFSVYMKLAPNKNLRLVLNPIIKNYWIITAYRKD